MEDPGWAVGRRCSSVVVEFFLQLFARPRAGEDDLDVTALGETREPDEVAGEVQHADRLAHVEHEDFTTPSRGARLEDQMCGLGDGAFVATSGR